jgi:periplasmic divalent cation tolerance protein
MTAPDEALIAVHTTVANHDDARRLAREVITARLAACAQLEPIESLYIWKGELVEEPEFRITFKTTRTRLQALMQVVREAHPYEIPAITATPQQDPDPDYLNWVVGQTRPLAG